MFAIELVLCSTGQFAVRLCEVCTYHYEGCTCSTSVCACDCDLLIKPLLVLLSDYFSLACTRCGSIVLGSHALLWSYFVCLMSIIRLGTGYFGLPMACVSSVCTFKTWL